MEKKEFYSDQDKFWFRKNEKNIRIPSFGIRLHATQPN